MVYLSRGSISASVGISAFHRSNDLRVSPFLANAVLSVSTTWSTARNRFRWRAFWVGERRHGIFLLVCQRQFGVDEGPVSEVGLTIEDPRLGNL